MPGSYGRCVFSLLGNCGNLFKALTQHVQSLQQPSDITQKASENLEVESQDYTSLQLKHRCVIYNISRRTKGRREDTISLERILLSFQDARSMKVSWGSVFQVMVVMVVVEGKLGAGQKHRLERCPTRGLCFLCKVPLSSYPHALPDWKLRKPNIDFVSPVWALNYIVTQKYDIGYKSKMNWKPGLLLRTCKFQEVEGTKIKMGRSQVILILSPGQGLRKC